MVLQTATTMALDAGTGLPVSTVVGVLSIFTGKADRQIEDAAREMYQDLALELQRRVLAVEAELAQQGKKLDELPDILVAATIEQLRRHALEGTSRERLDALLNATARQFDPNMGNAGVRKFWLDRLAALSDLETFLLVNIARQPVVLSSQPRGLYRIQPDLLSEVQREPARLNEHGVLLLGDSEESFVPLQHGLARLKEQGLAEAQKQNQTVQPVVLTKQGRLLAALASPPRAPRQ